MSSKDQRPAKRRAGRHRLPPLAPGPALHFIVATHPDDFRATAVLRNVRSHVMYKHQETRASSPTVTNRSRESSSAPSALTPTPSPTATDCFGVLQTTTSSAPAPRGSSKSVLNERASEGRSPPPPVDPLRSLAERILSAANRTSTRSAPAAYEGASEYPFSRDDVFRSESLDELKLGWIRATLFFCHGKSIHKRPGCCSLSQIKRGCSIYATTISRSSDMCTRPWYTET